MLRWRSRTGGAPGPERERTRLKSSPRYPPHSLFFFLMIRPPPRSTPFPYPTLFRSWCVTPSARLADALPGELARQAARSPRRVIVERSLADHGVVVVVPDLDAAVEVANRRAPEHVEPLVGGRSEEHTSELPSRLHLVCRLLLVKKNNEA